MTREMVDPRGEWRESDDYVWHAGRSMVITEDPEWVQAWVPARHDRPWEVWFARAMYPYRQSLRFRMWYTMSIYRFVGTWLVIIFFVTLLLSR